MLKKFTKKLELRYAAAILTCISAIGVISVSAMFDAPAVQITLTEVNEFTDESSTKKIKTKEMSVEELLSSQGVEISAHDVLYPALDSQIQGDTEILVKRGIPFMIAADGNLLMCSTTKSTVGEALLECGYYPEEDDIISPDVETPVTDNLTISITRVSSENIVVTETIQNETKYVDDSTLEKGKTKVVSEGSVGYCAVTLKLVYNNGVEVSREEISRVVTKQPEHKVIANGTKPAPTPTPKAVNQKITTKKTSTKSTTKTSTKSPKSVASSASLDISYSKKLTMNATGYSAFASDGSRAKTASGRTAGHGIVAVDTSVIPLGTKLYIEGYGHAVAGDTGSAIKGNKIDLCFELTNAEIRQSFGRKNVTVYVLN